MPCTSTFAHKQICKSQITLVSRRAPACIWRTFAYLMFTDSDTPSFRNQSENRDASLPLSCCGREGVSDFASIVFSP